MAKISNTVTQVLFLETSVDVLNRHLDQCRALLEKHEGNHIASVPDSVESLISELQKERARLDWAIDKLMGADNLRDDAIDYGFDLNTPGWERLVIDKLMEAENVEQCENGCNEPVTHHDAVGIPLCAGCWKELCKQWEAEEFNVKV